MTNAPALAVLGFRPHTYWTSVVALGGRAKAPQVLERRKVVFAAGDERGVYHQAAEIGPDERQALLVKVRAATVANAVAGVAGLIADLQLDRLTVRDAVVSAGNPRAPEALNQIITAHSRIHAAEGNFYRDVVAAACEAVGLTVHRVAERDMPQRVCALLHTDGPSLEERLKEMGKTLGSPWSEDFKLATQAAWGQRGA
jgi:hypothetical protein